MAKKSKKRSVPPEEKESDDEENMEIIEEKEEEEGEENNAVDGDDDNADDDDDDVDKDEEPSSSQDIPFLDTFYRLASNDPKERATAAQMMLHHCLLGPDANSKDTEYAFKRLLNGLCSGRAAARQGFASALTSFLKLASTQGKLEEIRDDGDSNIPLVSLVRRRLIEVTDPTTDGKKKGSEERDHYFGRLFGILSIIRSGILLPKQTEAACGIANDLVELYNHRKWMREPTGHAIIHLIDLFYKNSATTAGNQVVSTVIAPKLLVGSHTDGLASYTPEQIAIALNIQCQAPQDLLSDCLREPVLSLDTIPALASALSSTSIVSQPRAHAVWEIIWLYLTEAKKQKSKKPQIRVLKKKLPNCSDDPKALVESLIQSVVIHSLLGLDEDGSRAAAGHHNATHERRALALSIIKVFSGGTSVSGKFGSFQIQLPAELIRTAVLSNVIVQRLFLDIVCAGGGKSSHHLKPYAIAVLDSIAAPGTLSSQDLDRRLECTKALLDCEPRFDGRTKSQTCSNLMLFNSMTEETVSSCTSVWNKYVAYLEERVIALSKNEQPLSYEVISYVDLLFSAAKKFLQCPQGDFRTGVLKQTISFFFTGAFFDCSSFEHKTSGDNCILDAATKMESSFPYSVRIVMSSRFFSLLSDTSGLIQREESGNKSQLLKLLVEICAGWSSLEAGGGKRLWKAEPSENDDEDNKDDDDDYVSREDVAKIIKEFSTPSKSEDSFADSCKALVFILKLHLLRCGDAERADEDGEVDIDEDEDDETEINQMISDLTTTLSDLKSLGKVSQNDSDWDSKENPINNLAQICVGVLSSPFGDGGQSRGASPTLLREAVKSVWASSLAFCGDKADAHALFDSETIQILLSAVGIVDDDEPGDGDADMDGESADEGDGSDEHIFSKAQEMDIDDDDDDDNKEGSDEEDASDKEDEDGDENEGSVNESEDSDDEDDDVEVDPSQLQNLLLEDGGESDDEDVLEHHGGADAALAKLIKLRQEARKAGQQARERAERTVQLRNTVLLDSLVVFATRQKQPILQPELICRMLIPMLQTRRKLEKSLALDIDTGKRTLVKSGEKRALMEKITATLKKLFKLKKMAASKDPVSSDAERFVDLVLTEARRATTTEQSKCCSGTLSSVLRMNPACCNDEKVSKLFDEMVTEWSTSRSTKLRTTLLEDLVMQQPGPAQRLLTKSLCAATSEARSAFTKCEALNLLGTMATKASALGETDVEPPPLKDFAKELVWGMVKVLADEEMRRPKRIKEVLKATDKITLFLTKSEVSEPSIVPNLNEISSSLKELADGLETTSLQQSCTSINERVQEFCQKQQEIKESLSATPSSSAKKKKKTKKKKKGRK